MPEYVATTPGLFPLPDWAKETLSDLKGHQKHDLIDGNESEAVAAEYDAARSEIVETQIEAGLDRVVEGQLRWDDMLAHPLSVNDAVETGGIVRYYDNNNFYRDPSIVGQLTPSGDIGAELGGAAELTDEPVQAVLPGPYSLAALATDEHYGDEAALIAAVGDLLVDEIAAFPPVETLFLLEPSLTTSPPTADRQDVVRAAIDDVSEAFSGEVVVHGYWGAFDERSHGMLLDSGVDAIGYDLVSAPEACAELVREQGSTDSVALGVVDGQNTLIEAPGDVRERVEWFESRLGAGPETVYVTANTELFYLPESKFEAKLRVLGEATAPAVTA